MSRQGLHRMRGHRYRSTTAIFPEVLVAYLGTAGQTQLGLQPGGKRGWWTASGRSREWGHSITAAAGAARPSPAHAGPGLAA